MGELQPRKLGEQRHQLRDRGLAELRIGGVRGDTTGAQHGAHCALRPQGELPLGWLATDEYPARARALVRRVRTVVRDLLAHQKEQCHRNIALAQLLRREDHRRRDALRVARAAAPQRVTIDARRKIRRHRVEMCRQRHERLVHARREHVDAAGAHRNPPHAPPAALQHEGHVRHELALVPTRRVDRHQLGSEPQDVVCHRSSSLRVAHNVGRRVLDFSIATVLRQLRLACHSIPSAVARRSPSMAARTPCTASTR